MPVGVRRVGGRGLPAQKLRLRGWNSSSERVPRSRRSASLPSSSAVLGVPAAAVCRTYWLNDSWLRWALARARSFIERPRAIR